MEFYHFEECADLSVRQFDAIIFDLDGVVTDTAKVHAAAWKELFDGYLESKKRRDGEPLSPFDPDVDYTTYLDGKPRYEGVQSFLESRGIVIAKGDPTDGTDQETICGLGNKKNHLFKKHLKRDGVEVFPSSVELIRQLKARRLKTAIVSSSKNCLAVLQSAGLEDTFDARVDGVVSASLGLKGKPNPDIFLKGAEILGVEARRSVVVEDSIAGVEAARAGQFGMVIGVDRINHGNNLREKGAHWVVRDLGEVHLTDIDSWFRQHKSELPSALDRMDEIKDRLAHKQTVVFLDYDGTLTPIVEIPDRAFMSKEMRDVVRQLSTATTVAIVSGRARSKVHDFVQLDSLIYAGSHGFDIAGPHHATIQHKEGNRFLPALGKAYQEITEKIKGIHGSLVEQTGFSISVHYRMVSEDQVPLVEEMVDETLGKNPSLRKTHGKKVFEIRPKIDWDKGKAVLWILKALELDQPDVVPFYLGDDTTDEDAFRALADKGIGVLVADVPRPSTASYRLKDIEQVKEFLIGLTKLLKGS